MTPNGQETRRSPRGRMAEERLKTGDPSLLILLALHLRLLGITNRLDHALVDLTILVDSRVVDSVDPSL